MELFSTADMYLAATLLTENVKLLRVDRDDPRHIHFVFDPEGRDLDALVADFTNGTLMVSASRFQEAIRKVKSLIHAG
jgi:hypothetical protein